MIKVCPSTNPCPERDIVRYVKQLQNMGVEMLHIDVMDGEFVENKCMQPIIIKQIKQNTLMQLEAHLMVKEPLEKLNEYLNIGLNYITIHYEAFENKQDFLKAISKIHDKNKLVGISIKPSTHISAIINYLPLVDLVLIMSVEPGKSGQKFMPEVLEKIQALSLIREKNKFNFKIEIDGGVNLDNIQKIVDYGTDLAVVGSALYNSEDKQSFIITIENTSPKGSSLNKFFPNYKKKSMEELEKELNRILCK